MDDLARCGFVLLIFWLVMSSKESYASSNCTEHWLTACQSQFNENNLKICQKILELRSCLNACENDIWPSHAAIKVQYESLIKKVNSFPDCLPPGKVHRKLCSEELANRCYQKFNRNSSSICREVKNLRMCISELKGCDVMKKHPKFVLSMDILEKHRKCFFVNYSRILEVLKKKDNAPKPVIVIPKVVKTPKTVKRINVTIKPSASESEPQSEHLPYTFVVVATVCTCMFLVVLVVFSIVRHTTLSKRQRNSIVVRAPPRIHIRTQNRRYRTRRHHHHRHHRGHVVIQGARQTVSGFFEGKVAPPPYSAVLDDNESVRAGDPPPPYRPPSCMALGVIV
ncbi:uncharacterized protein LOC111320551 [Stylophora pistillata]|uniref:uncharacterized protein LOC111320551 n=1 Tax=Stylophora pistillata TaxID=50429 RepID=UPI000C0519E2|nr:uncharacterized protein LOC111320551 [Stylophora pistillata]